MELAAVFDPTNATSGQFTASTLQVGSTMIVDNKSYVDLIFTFASGDKRLIIANDRRAFQFSDASSVPGPFITWSQQNIDYPQTINQLQNICYVEIYAPTEKVIETYPNPIQRETLPTLVPYDIGYTSTGLFSVSSTTNDPVIWPSSYYGVTVAPSAVQGMNFDHFWSDTYVANNGTLFDVPGSFPSTGKTANNGTLNNRALATNIPGPFSKPGLTPVDSATHLSGTYWQCASAINWNGASSGILIDAWINPTQYMQYILGDDNPAFNQTGLYILIQTNGTLDFNVGNGVTHTPLHSNTVIPLNEWTYVAARVNVTDNTIELWINGVFDSSASFTGPVANTTEVLSIGRDTRDNVTSTSFVGSICNVGILLSDITTTQWGKNAIQARYELGLQSLNVNMQKVWITGVDFTAFANVTSTSYSTVLLDNIYNPAGLLYVDNSASTDPLHIINPFGNTLQWRFPAITATTINVQNFKPTNPITHLPLGFPQFIVSSLATNTELDLVVHGFNILGIK